MTLTMEYTERLVVTHCWCGIALAIPENLNSYVHRHKGKEVYCPLGHSFVYNDTTEERLAEERRQHAATKSLLHQEERSHAQTRGQLRREKKRVAAGVCPCCNRTFQQLSRHMKNKHPEYKPA
jgi:quinolinate synthase